MLIDVMIISVAAWGLYANNQYIRNSDPDETFTIYFWISRGWIVWTIIISSLILVTAFIMLMAVIYVSDYIEYLLKFTALY